VLIKIFGCENHENGIRGKFEHRVPIVRFEDKTFIRFIEDVFVFILSVIIVNPATSLDANGSLHGRFMPVSSTPGIIHTVDIEYAFYFKRDGFFDNGEIAPFVNKCFQIN
jgi:hypothetical protein